MLRVENLSVFYGGIHALKGVSIDVQEGQIVSIIGSNGAGKSTLLNTISGIVKPKEGRIEYKGKELPRLRHSCAGSRRKGRCAAASSRYSATASLCSAR